MEKITKDNKVTEEFTYDGLEEIYQVLIDKINELIDEIDKLKKQL